MRLNRLRDAATLPSLGETEASSAGEQLAEGYPSRAVTDVRRGRLPGLPAPLRYCPSMPQKTPAEGGADGLLAGAAEVARISGRMWPYFPERASPVRVPEQRGAGGSP